MKSVYLEPSMVESLLQLVEVVFSILITTLCSMKSVTYISSVFVTISVLLPQVDVDGSMVPVFFRDRSTAYHIFLVFTLVAFMCAFSTVMIEHKPMVERFWRITAVASMLSALAIVVYAAAL